jgi:hypothetical protein
VQNASITEERACLFFLQTIIFQSVEMESKWVAAVLSGRATLPGEEDMMAAVREHYRQMEEAGRPKRHTHVIMPNWVSELHNVSHWKFPARLDGGV